MAVGVPGSARTEPAGSAVAAGDRAAVAAAGSSDTANSSLGSPEEQAVPTAAQHPSTTATMRRNIDLRHVRRPDGGGA
jgi:hypothetical protein